MCWFKEAFPLSAFIIFVSLITSIRCDLTTVFHAIKGGKVKLEFPYVCNSSNITLQCGNEPPFYSSANQDLVELNPDQSERLIVENTTKRKEDHCLLQLSIDPVEVFDARAPYILFGYYITIRIGLPRLPYIRGYMEKAWLRVVDSLPGVAHCSFGDNHDNAGSWKKLHCKATVGNMPGQIQCYQGDMRMPYLDVPSENDNTLKQTIWVQRNCSHVYCCYSLLIEPKERCACNDSVLDPLSQGEVHNPGDPCPTTTHATTAPLTTSYHHDHTSSTVRAIIPTKGEIKEYIYPINKILIGFTVSFALVIIFFIVYKITYVAQSKLMRRRRNEKKTVAETACVYVKGVNV